MDRAVELTVQHVNKVRSWVLLHMGAERLIKRSAACGQGV